MNADKKGTILLVEDEYSNYYFLQILLRNLGFDVVLALNGQEAVDFVNSEQQIDLVLMDLKMPIMNGFEATRKIKSIKPELPIVAQTAYIMGSDRHMAMEAGCNAYITKPIKKPDLVQVLNQFLPDSVE